METFLKVVGAVVVVLAIVAAIALVMTFPTMWMMNYLFTPHVLLTIFGVSQMTFWKALWLNVLIGYFFSTGRAPQRKTEDSHDSTGPRLAKCYVGVFYF